VDTLGFLLKKAIIAFCYPLGLSLLLIAAGLIMLRIRPAKRTGFFVALAGALLLVIMSAPITGYSLMRTIQTEYSEYCDPAALRSKGVRYIVVLAAECVRADRTPADRLGGSVFRVLEGVRLWKGAPEAKLALSAGSTPSCESSPDAIADLPRELGAPKDAILVEWRAWDTSDEAEMFSQLVGGEPFALVTSAAHMPRAVELFRRRGKAPVACPCQIPSPVETRADLWFLPSAQGLLMSHTAIHEYLGILWYAVRQKLTVPWFRDATGTRRQPGRRG
jgi:uncharacterized SAM-binding protein YcdF (DUF218 family)